MAAHRLRHILGLGSTGAKLDSIIAIALGIADRHDLYIIQFQNRDRNMTTSIIKDARHSQFAGNNSATHCLCPFPKA